MIVPEPISAAGSTIAVGWTCASLISNPLTSILSPYVRGEAENNCAVAGRSRVAHTPGRLALGKGEGEGSLLSFLEESEHQLAFGDDCVVHYAVALRFRHAIATRSRQLGVNENRVAWKNWFAKFHLIRAHEIADTA